VKTVRSGWRHARLAIMGNTLFIQGVGHGPSSEKIRCMSTHTCTLHSVRGSGNSWSPMIKPSHALQPSPTEPGKHGNREPRYRRKKESPRRRGRDHQPDHSGESCKAKAPEGRPYRVQRGSVPAAPNS
jgi:hypothetical protein